MYYTQKTNFLFFNKISINKLECLQNTNYTVRKLLYDDIIFLLLWGIIVGQMAEFPESSPGLRPLPLQPPTASNGSRARGLKKTGILSSPLFLVCNRSGVSQPPRTQSWSSSPKGGQGRRECTIGCRACPRQPWGMDGALPG